MKDHSNNLSGVRDYDVLCGRGSGIAGTKGNVNFRRLVDAHRIEYNKAPRTEKIEIARMIFSKIEAKGGRFLIYDSQRKWVEVNKVRSIEKACQALREQVKSYKRNVVTTEVETVEKMLTEQKDREAPETWIASGSIVTNKKKNRKSSNNNGSTSNTVTKKALLKSKRSSSSKPKPKSSQSSKPKAKVKLLSSKPSSSSSKSGISSSAAYMSKFSLALNKKTTSILKKPTPPLISAVPKHRLMLSSSGATATNNSSTSTVSTTATKKPSFSMPLTTIGKKLPSSLPITTSSTTTATTKKARKTRRVVATPSPPTNNVGSKANQKGGTTKMTIRDTASTDLDEIRQMLETSPSKYKRKPKQAPSNLKAPPSYSTDAAPNLLSGKKEKPQNSTAKKRKRYTNPALAIWSSSSSSKPSSSSSTTSYWNEMYQALRQFHATFGHYGVPPDWAGHTGLADWTACQRHIYREIRQGYRPATKLEQERLQDLQKIQFPLDCQSYDEWHWKERFQELCLHLSRKSTTSMMDQSQSQPQQGRWVLPPSLALWLDGQRSCYRMALLPQDRRVKLESLGIVWKDSTHTILPEDDFLYI